MDSTEPVEALTLELEKAETAIQNLVHVLKQRGLYEASSLEGQISDRQKGMRDVARRGRAWLEQQEARARWDSET